MSKFSLTKAFLKIVPKVWGAELWIVNEPEYCGKFLEIKKGTSGSLHYHPIKKETFKILKGKIFLELGGKKQKLNINSPPVTIYSGVQHRITGITDATILEISTTHSDADVVRIEVSKG